MTVWYDDLAALNPATGAFPDGAEIQLYDYTDTAYTTPLTVTDASGIPTTKRIVGKGVAPGFNGPDLGKVWAKSGEWVTLWRSGDGLETAAQEARDAAQQAAATASGAVAAAVLSINAGSNITVSGDPKNPTISATGGGGGGGSVDSVNGVTPNPDGDVTLTAAQVGARSVSDVIDQSEVDGLQDALNNKANLSHSHTSSQISDATSIGRQLMQAATAEAARSAIGAGTSSGSGTADWNSLLNKPAVVAAGDDAAAARSSIGAGTSNLALGTSSTTALAGNAAAVSAAKLTTARTINGVSFDGTANITLTPEVLYVYYSGGWPTSRPNATTVVFIGGDDSHPPTIGTVGVDLWMKQTI